MANKNGGNQQPVVPGPGGAQVQGGQTQNENDPVAVLEKHSCTVFLPDTARNALDWDYLAGYANVKRDIEDTVLLALTHGDVYDKIT